MKIKALSSYSKILAFFLVMLGFSACKSPKEYGTPTAMLNLKGKVINEKTYEAIYAIEVTVQEVGGNGHFQEITSVTNSLGDFCFHVNVETAAARTYKISFKDIDGEANGEFEGKEVIVNVLKEDFIGAESGWNGGEADKYVGYIDLTARENE